MKKILGIYLGALFWLKASISYAADKFDILPDLPEPLATAQAASVSTTDNTGILASQSVGQEPNIMSVVLSLVFVVLLIYLTGIIYAKLNKLGFKTLKKQMGSSSDSRVSVVSTTPLGSNKTLHVVELDGKRMLIGASSSSIQLLKDLGTYPPVDIDTTEYSKIEIPNIRIPKIEIPKIEFPNIGFTRTSSKVKLEEETDDKTEENSTKQNNDSDGFEISEIYEEGPDGIIDKLFQTSSADNTDSDTAKVQDEHKVDPEEYALYKKYL